MATTENLLGSALHGTAWRMAIERRSLAESIAELRRLAAGRDDVLAQTAGLTAGTWLASPGTHVGHELVVAGMLILAAGGAGAPLDYQALGRWVQLGYERARAGGHSTADFHGRT